jgi:hypothetical protein
MRCEQCSNEFQGTPGEPCPRCGHSASTDAASEAMITAPLRYSPPPPPRSAIGATGGGDGPPGAPPPSAPARTGPPWEEGRSFESLFATIKGVLLLPTRTFREASQTAGIGPALLFGMLLGLVGGYLGLFWEYLARRASAGQPSEIFDSLPPDMLEAFQYVQSPIFLLVYAICLPVMAAIGMFLWAGIVHLCLMMLGGAKQGFEATFRTLAYSYGSTAVFQVVPFCGGLIGMVWSIVVQIIGLKEMHETGGGTATAAVLLPMVLCCCLCVGFFMLLFMLGGLAALTSN